MKILKTTLMLASLGVAFPVLSQSELYPQHFDLEEVELLSGPFKTALDLNNKQLLKYDVDRLLTPFIRQAGLDKAGSKYHGWIKAHPSFQNWGQDSWSLEGHIGGHYLTALSLGYAATKDESTRSALKERLEYCLEVLKDCQNAFAGNTNGMEGFIGGQPINQIWTGLYNKDLGPFNQYGGWVPFYCEHKILAGLRDAWIYAGNATAKELFKGICDWSVNVFSNLTEQQMQQVLGWEHGGMNETLADAYRIFGDEKYLKTARRYSHTYMIDGMSSFSSTFLDGKHANTQVPKYVGFERIYQEEVRDGGNGASNYKNTARNFWRDVAQNRTVCIGGNSVGEHFLAKENASRYISNLEGPESCNSNNMLKLTENLFDDTHDAKYADFYEGTMWNHILSTQDPKTGGYVYFTTLRPQGYRIYSTVNKGMWCCVGTGMENHGKYGHFIYTHSDDNKMLYVNLFTASSLDSDKFKLVQETDFPYSQSTKITIGKDGDFTLAVRHPSWVGDGYSIKVNGTAMDVSVKQGKASYAEINRTWHNGDVVEVTLPMSLRVEECPNYTDYVAFKYGPILLAAQTTAPTNSEASATGLQYEKMQNEYAGEGRMDHSPAAVGKGLAVSSSPLLIGDRDKLLERITPTDSPLRFNIDVASDESKGDWDVLQLVPFYTIHHARYCCYWYAQTPEKYLESEMGQADALEAAINERTIDYVATGEQQSEAGHDMEASAGSTKGMYQGEYYRDAQSGGYVKYTLENNSGTANNISLMVRFTVADRNRVGEIYVEGGKIADLMIPSSHPNANDQGFYNEEFEIPANLLLDAQGNVKSRISVKFVANGSTPLPGLYYIRLLKDFDGKYYKFIARDWVTGDANRVNQGKFKYDDSANTITIEAGKGKNNVCLMLDIKGKLYNVKATQKYLVVKGSNLSTDGGASYLWWLNGINHGSQEAPQVVKTAPDGDIVIAWDLTQSQLNGNCTGSVWNFCQGNTIFGLTSTTGTSVISNIGFTGDVDQWIAGAESIIMDNVEEMVNVYSIDGKVLRKNAYRNSALNGFPDGIYIVGNKKVIKRQQ